MYSCVTFINIHIVLGLLYGNTNHRNINKFSFKGHSNIATNVSLLKACEVQEIFEGNDQQFRASNANGNPSHIEAAARLVKNI